MIDISTPVDGDLPVWPGSKGPSFTVAQSIAEGSDANVTRMDADVHLGTHVDAPLHFVADGASLEALGLEPLVGPAFVADARQAERLGRAELDALAVPAGTTRLLLRTSNSDRRRLRRPEFDEDAVALTAEGSQWVVDRQIVLIGIDYLSIQRFDEGPETHQILLRAGVAILQGLALEDAPAGRHDLLCLPIRLAGPEAAPARAVLLPEGTLN